MQNKKKEARKIDFFLPHGGCQKCVCVMWPYTKHSLQHGPYMRVHPSMSIVLVIQNSTCKVTCCLLSKVGCFV